MTTQEIQPKEEQEQEPIVEPKDEEISEKSPQEMKPPLETKVPKSSIVTKHLKSENAHTCNICQKTFKASQPLRYHIRQMYFNLKAKTLSYEMKKINQVWVEKVLNTNELIEITKKGRNTLIMKKTNRDAIVDTDNLIQEIDLSNVYPTQSKYECKVCNVCELNIPRKRFKKHLVSHMI